MLEVIQLQKREGGSRNKRDKFFNKIWKQKKKRRMTNFKQESAELSCAHNLNNMKNIVETSRRDREVKEK